MKEEIKEGSPVLDMDVAIEQLHYDILDDAFKLFKSVGANIFHKEGSDKCEQVFVGVGSDLSHKNMWRKTIDKIAEWLTSYEKLCSCERLSFSDLVITEANDDRLRGVLIVHNGMNGITQMSRQSLKHVMDVVTHMEDYYGARVHISDVGAHSDCYYYALSFCVWKRQVDSANNDGDFANLKPLFMLDRNRDK